MAGEYACGSQPWKRARPSGVVSLCTDRSRARFRQFAHGAGDPAPSQDGKRQWPHVSLLTLRSRRVPISHPSLRAPYPGLGELLRSARARRGLALQQVCNETKIPRRYLEAVEQDRLEALPGGLYRRAHVRAYAQAVQLDPGLLAQLERDLKASVPIEAIPGRPRKRAAGVLTRTRGLIQIGLLRAAAYVEQALRKQALYLNTHARNFRSWSQQRVTALEGSKE